MKEIKIKIYGWSDLKKWFWDKFCFPRRKIVDYWLDYHNDLLRSDYEALLIKYGDLDVNKPEDMNRLHSALNDWDKAVEKSTICTRTLIMLK